MNKKQKEPKKRSFKHPKVKRMTLEYAAKELDRLRGNGEIASVRAKQIAARLA